MGRIGQAVARRALAFGMDVAYLPSPRKSAGASVSRFDRAARRGRCRSTSCCATSDVIAIHAPLTPETHHMIDAQALARMKPIRVSGQRRARAGRRRGGAGLGAARAA